MLCLHLGNYAFHAILKSNFLCFEDKSQAMEWLTFILDANGQRGTWISMLQDFHFKIIHKLGNKHTYVNALS
jgi:hypothetical protein